MSGDPYATLGISRNADESAVKKAYRKLALKWHPDKNPDNPSAEAKFKKISEAYALLSDPKRKSEYDRFGTTEERPSHRGGGHGPEMTPEDIFNMFFNGGMGAGGGGSYHYEFGGGGRQRQYQQQQRRPRQPQEPQTPQAMVQQLLPLLPLLFVFLMSNMGSSSESKAEYMLQRSSEFYLPRYTSRYNVKYFTRGGFDGRYTSGGLHDLENRIESDYRRQLKTRCNEEKQQLRVLKDLVDSAADDPHCDATCRQRRVDKFEMESCILLKQKFASR